MERKAVTSSNIKSIGYDPDTKTLEVEFSSGGVYQYTGVEPEKHAALMASDSKGAYLSANIKGQHPHSKADAGKAAPG